MEPKEKIKKKRRGKKKKREIAYSLVIILLLAVGALFFYQTTKKEESATSKPFVPSIAPPKPETGDENPNQIVFATNGKETVYKVQDGNKWAVIWNGIKSKDYDYISNPVFSPDGTQFAFNAETSSQSYVVVNNVQVINAYQKADNIVFSQNNQTIAFLAAQNNNTYVVISSPVASPTAPAPKVTQSLPIVQPGTVTTSSSTTTSIILSPDGSQVAYVVQNDGEIQVVVNGQTSASYDSISDFTLNNDGTYSYQAQSGSQTVTVVNNQIISPASSTSSTSSSTTTTGNSTSPVSGEASSSKTSPPSAPYYPYQWVSGQDVNMPANRVDYTDCPSGNC